MKMDEKEHGNRLVRRTFCFFHLCWGERAVTQPRNLCDMSFVRRATCAVPLKQPSATRHLKKRTKNKYKVSGCQVVIQKYELSL
jgi:hypothetical protein